MSINILSLHFSILQKLNHEELLKQEEIQTVENFISDKSYHFDFDVVEKLTNLKQLLLYEKEHEVQFFLTQTHLIIEEYKTILKNPISHLKEKTLPILQKKKNLIMQYLNIVNELIENKKWIDFYIPLISSQSQDTYENYCFSCGNDEEDKFEIDDFNRQTCLNCSSQQQSIEIGISHNHYSRVNVIGKFIYNRVLHFQDCIKQYQGKQNCKIPEQVLKDLETKFLAYRLLLTDGETQQIKYSKITCNFIMIFLKELKYTKQYENVNLIYFILTNKRVDDISHLEEQLVEDFKELAFLYDEIHGKDKEEELQRKNFLNAQYLLFQLLRRHGHPCKKENFAILKTVDRKKSHDDICKNLFNKLGWKHTPIF